MNPSDIGFKYNDIYDEWQKPFYGGLLIIKVNYCVFNLWELLYCDENDNVYNIIKGVPYAIIEFIKGIKTKEELNNIINTLY